MAKQFTSVRLPSELVEELQIWRTAYERAYGRGRISYEFMIRGWLQLIEEGEPAVFEEMSKMLDEDPELIKKTGNTDIYSKHLSFAPQR